MAKEANLHSTPISFAERLASSDSFKTLFREGMQLVEDTATYLDGTGRADSKGLPRLAALAYASESMRLTTRLMQIASWLLLQRAVNEGEITQAEALTDKQRTCLTWSDSAPDEVTLPSLPEELRKLIDTSLRLQERVVHLDALISDPETDPAAAGIHPLEDQLSKLRAAFCE
jgi:regulator of CtrA degradation